MKTLLRILPTGPVWPYSFLQLRLDEPRLSISKAPHEGEIASWLALDPPIVIIEPTPTEPPTYDETTHYLAEAMPVEVNGQWQQAWRLEEIPPQPIVPDYQGFYNDLLVSNAYNLVLQQVMAAAGPGPAAALAVLISALQDALNGRANPNALQSSIWLLLGQLTLPPEAAVELQSLLNDNNLADLYLLTPPEPKN
jgi:hypothetical protein